MGRVDVTGEKGGKKEKKAFMSISVAAQPGMSIVSSSLVKRNLLDADFSHTSECEALMFSNVRKDLCSMSLSKKAAVRRFNTTV